MKSDAERLRRKTDAQLRALHIKRANRPGTGILCVAGIRNLAIAAIVEAVKDLRTLPDVPTPCRSREEAEAKEAERPDEFLFGSACQTFATFARSVGADPDVLRQRILKDFPNAKRMLGQPIFYFEEKPKRPKLTKAAKIQKRRARLVRELARLDALEAASAEGS